MCSGARPTAGSRWSIRTWTSSTTTSRSPRGRVPRSSRSSRRTCRPTTSPGCHNSSRGLVRARACPRGRASRSSTTRCDAGRPDLHAHGEHTVEEMARALYRSLTERLLTLPHHLVLYPSHYSGSVCGRGLSANPISTIGFERRNNDALQYDSEHAFVEALVRDIPPAPADQTAIVAANRAGSRVSV